MGAAVGGGKALAALGVVGKAGKGTAIPVPTPTKSTNGLVYQSNGKHTPAKLAIIEMQELNLRTLFNYLVIQLKMGKKDTH